MLSEKMPPYVEKLLQNLHGVVLDLGPGTGTQMRRLNPTNVTKIYGVEPNTALHEELRKSADKAGFGQKYIILSAGAEPDSLVPALAKEGLLKDGASQGGIFDEILCLRVLCGVPQPRETIAGLYRLLKPGGRIIVCEHVRNWPFGEVGSMVGSALQLFYTYLCCWSFWTGGCQLTRDTGKWIKELGGKDGWKEVKVEYIESWSPVPYVIGYLVKAD
jgi:SAM-dependent methyltransferase